MATHALESAAVFFEQNFGFADRTDQNVQQLFADCHGSFNFNNGGGEPEQKKLAQPVSRFLYRPRLTSGGNHSSGPPITERLKRPTRK